MYAIIYYTVHRVPCCCRRHAHSCFFLILIYSLWWTFFPSRSAQVVTVALQPGEKCQGEPGSMMYLSPQVEMLASYEGCWDRCCGGESCFVLNYTNQSNNERGYAALVPSDPLAKVVPIDLSSPDVGGCLIVQQGEILLSVVVVGTKCLVGRSTFPEQTIEHYYCVSPIPTQVPTWPVMEMSVSACHVISTVAVVVVEEWVWSGKFLLVSFGLGFICVRRKRIILF